MTKAVVALVAAAFSSAAQSPAPRSQPLRAVVVSVANHAPRCPQLSLAESLGFQGAAAWLSNPYSFWFVVDAAGQLVSSLERLSSLDRSQLTVWSDRNRNGVRDSGEVRPYPDVVAKVAPNATRVEASYVCRAKAAAEIHRGYYPGLPPATQTAQAVWEIEITTDPVQASYLYGSSAVEGVRASVTKSGDQYLFQVTNLRSVPIDALSIFVERPDGGGLGYRSDMYRVRRSQELGRKYGPIMPGETREVRLGKAMDDTPVKAVVVGVLFEDMHFEGNHSQRTEWFEEREDYAVGLIEWITALRSAARASEPALGRKILEDTLAERQARITGDVPRHNADGILAQLLPRVASGEALLSQMTDNLVTRFEQELKAATRHLSAGKR